MTTRAGPRSPRINISSPSTEANGQKNGHHLILVGKFKVLESAKGVVSQVIINGTTLKMRTYFFLPTNCKVS